MSPSDDCLVLSDLSCGFPARTVLAGVSSVIKKQSIVAILGNNGSGKTTLLRTLGGTLPPLSGSITLFGESLTQLNPTERAKRIAYVPQSEAPHFAFTVRQVVALGRLPHSSGLFESAADWEAIARALAMVDCEHLEHRLVTEISGGERQRVLIARALAQEAPILLLDEPSSHLDLRHHFELAETLSRIADSGTTIVASLHDLNLAADLATHALVLNNGHKQIEGSIKDVLCDARLDEIYGVPLQRHNHSGGAPHIIARRPEQKD